MKKSTGTPDKKKRAIIILAVTSALLLAANIFLIINTVEISREFESKYDFLADRMVNNYYSPENLNNAIKDTLGDKYEEKDSVHQSNYDNFDNYLFTLVTNDINKYETKRKKQYNRYLNSEKAEKVTNMLESYEKAEVSVSEDNICTVKFSKFVTDETYSDLASHKDEFSRCRNFIFDLRENNGGDIEELLDVLSMFYEKDTLVFTSRGNSETEEYRTDKDKIIDFDRIVFLCGGKTASSSEMLIYIMQSDFKDKVFTVGQHTYGKNFSFTYSKFTDGEAFMLIDGIMGNSAGDTFGDDGIEPDYPAENEECEAVAEKIIKGEISAASE